VGTCQGAAADGRECCAARRQRREEERLQREMQQREQEEALALLEGQKKRGKGIKLKVGFPRTSGLVCLSLLPLLRISLSVSAGLATRAACDSRSGDVTLCPRSGEYIRTGDSKRTAAAAACISACRGPGMITTPVLLQDGEKLDKDALMREALSGQMKERQDLEKKLGQQVR